MRSALRIGFAGLAALALAACSGGSTAPSGGAAPAATTAPAPAATTAPAPAATTAAAPAATTAAAPAPAATTAPAAAASNAQLTASDVGVTPTTILIGGTDPLSGPAAAYGTIPKAADAYFHYVNDNGGVNGRQITYTYLDDGYDPAQTVPLTKQLVEQNQVFATYAGLGTQTQTSVRDYLNTNKVPQVFVATGATTFQADFQQYPYTFGYIPAYQGEAAIYAQYLLKNSPNAKVGIIYQNDDYGQDYVDGLTKALGSKAGDMIVDKENNDVGAADLSSQILKLKSSGVDTWFVFETPSPAIKALTAAFQADWHPTTYLNSVANPVPYIKAVQKATGDPKSVDGMITTEYLKDPTDPSQANDAGIQLYKQIMGKYYSQGDVTDGFNMAGMAPAYTFVDALKKVGPNLTRQGLLDALANLNETDNPFVYKGIAVKTTPTDHYTITQQFLAKFSAADGYWKSASDPIDVRGQIKYP
jgi:ABC-type branched-subunit amino acid transport system substrate-binding protein